MRLLEICRQMKRLEVSSIALSIRGWL
jgi:hypothetical protein